MELYEFFEPCEKLAVLHMGDICSDYLMYAAAACKLRARVYLAESPEFSGAKLSYEAVVAKVLGLESQVLEQVPGEDMGALLRRFKARAKKDGYVRFAEPAGAELQEDSPRVRLCRELEIAQPFRNCMLDSGEVRRRAGNAGFRQG